jgi:penicillin amidase
MAPRSIWAPALASLAAALAVAAPASAGVRRAGSVIPPGQSGFVSVPGVASGTGSPHLYDQTNLWLSFGHKPATFGQPGTTETPRSGVTIVRDAFGVPAITGRTEDDMWFGAGYAVAQDRLFQLEVFRRLAHGRLASMLGKSYLDRDKAQRREYYTPAELDAQLARLPAALRPRFASYRDGINAWVDKVQSDPSKLPGEFPAVGVTPTDWTVRDTLALGVYLVRAAPDDGPAELKNARALKALGRRVFNRLLPIRVRGQVATVPKRRRFARDPGRTRRQERRALLRSTRFLAGVPLPADPPYTALPSRNAPPTEPSPEGTSSARGAPRPPFIDFGRRGSIVWAVRGPGRTATLFNGPQLDYDVPSIFVEQELHGPGLHARGFTVPGAPAIATGHNGHVAWGITTGASDQDDLFVERLAGQERYLFRGRTETMSCRDERFEWRPPPAI